MQTPICKHTGETPVIIGGHKVWLLGSQYATRADLWSACDIFLPLNDSTRPLDTAPFGKYLRIASCGLPDRGGVPPDWAAFIAAIAKQIRKGQRVAAWCTGSHGRTGTFGASLIAHMEPSVSDPIAEIRKRHCTEAVESLKQAEAIFALRGESLPAAYTEEFKPKPATAVQYSGYVSGGGHTQSCLCEACIKRGTLSQVHMPERGKFTGSQPCTCRMCTIYWKMSLRIDPKSELSMFEDAHQPLHPWDCVCTKCWFVLENHEPLCTCTECVYCNTGAPELEDTVDAIDSGKIITIDGQPVVLDDEVDNATPIANKGGSIQ